MPGRVCRAVGIAGAAGLLVAPGCARPGPPPGGPEDLRPPVVATVEPEPLATLEPGNHTLRVRFSERISERPVRGTLSSAVSVSPRTGAVEVSHERHGIDIKVEGGFRPGLVYRVAIEPVLQDMFGNRMAVPFEWVFSTGGEVRPNAVVGAVWDATTGEPVEEADVVARRRTDADAAVLDTAAYVALSDARGIFVLRYLPEGPLSVVVWEERNGNGEPDFSEARIEREVTLGPTDTLTLAHLPLLPNDTTPAEVVGVTVLDSMTVRIEFDDYLDPIAPVDALALELLLPTDSLGAVLEEAAGLEPPAVVRRFHEADFAEWADSVFDAAPDPRSRAALPDSLDPVADSLALPPDTLAADTVLAPADTIAAVRSTPLRRQTVNAARELLPDGRPVPQRSFVIRLGTPLPAGVPLRLRVEGVINLTGLPGGGGEARALREAPAPPPDPGGGSVPAPWAPSHPIR
ncbi:MAG: Ig-like domain-containing protein [Longimicrobiales bacterium]|nr:Ig-like domain-containing protein [Longimicrobiales bacterium]